MQLRLFRSYRRFIAKQLRPKVAGSIKVHVKSSSMFNKVGPKITANKILQTFFHDFTKIKLETRMYQRCLEIHFLQILSMREP